MLGPPIAWAVAFLFVFGFAELACAAGIAGARLAGVSVVRWAAFAAIAVATVVALYSGRISYRWWRELSDGPSASPTGAERFAASFGMLLAGLFSVGLLFLALTLPFAPPCFP